MRKFYFCNGFENGRTKKMVFCFVKINYYFQAPTWGLPLSRLLLSLSISSPSVLLHEEEGASLASKALPQAHFPFTSLGPAPNQSLPQWLEQPDSQLLNRVPFRLLTQAEKEPLSRWVGKETEASTVLRLLLILLEKCQCCPTHHTGKANISPFRNSPTHRFNHQICSSERRQKLREDADEDSSLDSMKENKNYLKKLCLFCSFPEFCFHLILFIIIIFTFTYSFFSGTRKEVEFTSFSSNNDPER